MNKVFQAAIILTVAGFFLLNTVTHAAVVTCSGLVADNKTNNTQAFHSCVSAAQSQSEKTVVIPTSAGIYYFGDNVTSIPEGITVKGGSTDRTQTRVRATFSLANYSTVEYLSFESMGGRAIIIGGPGTKYISGATVRYCQFKEFKWAVIHMGRANDSIIDNNMIFNKTGRYLDNALPGSNIQLLGGKRNKISNNHIIGGLTCIIGLYARDWNGGGYESLIEENLIDSNYCENWLEEGISFDVMGDSRIGGSTLEYDTVASAAGSTVTLSHANWQQSGNPSHVGYDMIFMDGALHGQTRRIIRHSGSLFTFEHSVSGAANGDKVVIGATFKNNIISNNEANWTNTAGGWTPILLYGMAFNNIIENNNVRGIYVRALDNLARQDISVTRAYGRAPTGYNLIRNNTTREIRLSYYAIPEMQGHANTYSTPYMYGNTVINHNISTLLYSYHQYAHFSGNTGGMKKEFFKVNSIPLSLKTIPQSPNNFSINVNGN